MRQNQSGGTYAFEEFAMILPDFLSSDATGEIRFRGSRIGLYHIVQYYNGGYSAEMLACQYPTLPLALIYKAIGFYLENRGSVDSYAADCEKSLREQRADNPRRLELANLRERLTALQAAEIG